MLDDCGCCQVCARQLNEDCDKLAPCDPHKGLECNFGADPLANRGICWGKGYCVVEGRVGSLEGNKGLCGVLGTSEGLTHTCRDCF